MKLQHLFITLILLPLAIQAQSLATQADVVAFTGAKVHTVGPQGTLENASIVVSNGVITAVGTNLQIPANARQVNLEGRIVTPGLFTALGQLGLTEVGAVDGTVDFVQRGDAFTAAFDIADAYNPNSTLVAVNRREGITRAAITPRSAGPDGEGNVSHIFAGLGALVQLSGKGDPLTRRAAMLVVHMGEAGSTIAGGSRAAALLQLRTALDDALDYAGHKAEFDSGNRRSYSVSRADLEALQSVIEGQTPLLIYVDRASDISVLLALKEEYGLQMTLAGGAEAWMLADELAAAGVGVILSSVNNLPGSFDELNARLDAAAILADAGVNVAFGGNRNMQNHNARNITQAAGIAVANGLTWEAGLRAITLAPAEFYGVADTLGSITVGKSADLVIWADDPLELTSFPTAVFINGEEVSLQSRQSLLRDRYLQNESEMPPAFRK